MLGVFKDKYLSWMDLPVMTVIDIVEIVIIAFLFYTILLWIKNTRAWMLLKGLLVILVFVMVAAVFQMTTILWLAEKTLNVGVIALVIIFQPELRKALEELGRKNFFSSIIASVPRRPKKGAFRTAPSMRLRKPVWRWGRLRRAL